ncbi:hypothetical protein GCM10009304_17910 [Pseudomonas matsuisoli]|uniref:Uncharacterized protein n=1 Tax=Pseudomonas matsuisoli TaxID=1515666 RepID=A0A917PU87_9PSED|nr:hypothetical protein GCM10009304_17910 [Pseudomonas matsuisoli]
MTGIDEYDAEVVEQGLSPLAPRNGIGMLQNTASEREARHAVLYVSDGNLIGLPAFFNDSR